MMVYILLSLTKTVTPNGGPTREGESLSGADRGLVLFSWQSRAASRVSGRVRADSVCRKLRSCSRHDEA